jgi:hypothetical protein
MSLILLPLVSLGDCGRSDEDSTLRALIGYITGGGAQRGETPLYVIAGSFTGPTTARQGLVLRNNGGDDLPTSADPFFLFPTKLPDGSAYSVTVLTNSNGFACSVSNGAGRIRGSDITNIMVNCSIAMSCAPDCPMGYTCVSGVCLVIGSPGSSCSSDVDCQSGVCRASGVCQ